MAEITPVLPNAIDQLGQARENPADQLAVQKNNHSDAAKIMVDPDLYLLHARADALKLKDLQAAPSRIRPAFRTQEDKGGATTSKVGSHSVFAKFTGFPAK